MPLSPESLSRGLATVRYLYDLGLQQSRQAGLRRGVAILNFHDSVEMFLVLGLQHHDAYAWKRNYAFHEYWSEFANTDPPIRLTRNMETLNRARVNFKHHAIPPAASVIEDARVHVRAFLAENTPLVFGMNLEDVRLSALVQSSERARRHLETAERAMDAGGFDDAIGEIASAFHTLLADYQEGISERDPLGRGLRLNRVSIAPTFSGSVSPYASEGVSRFASDVARAVHELQVAVRVLSLGLDSGRWGRFVTIAPTVIDLGTGQLNRTEWHRENEPPTLDECQFCYDFVIDSALRLQEGM